MLYNVLLMQTLATYFSMFTNLNEVMRLLLLLSGVEYFYGRIA